MKRFFFITGKGGVGKTTFSAALTQHLNTEHKKVLYISFDSDQYNSSLEELNIPYLKLTIEECAEEYLTRKFKSSLIAKAILKTPFYKALSNIVPGFNNIIFLGKINQLLQDPEQYLVLDAPATGHALSIIESLDTFKKIFKQGLLFDDIEKVLENLFNEQYTEMIVISTPEKLVNNETEEFIQQLNTRGFSSRKILNKTLSLSTEIQAESNLPQIFKDKIKAEEVFLNEEKKIYWKCPFFLKENMSQTITEMKHELKTSKFNEKE